MAVREQVAKVIVGQTVLVDRLLAALLARGHLLVEGVPGLASSHDQRAGAGGRPRLPQDSVHP